MTALTPKEACQWFPEPVPRTTLHRWLHVGVLNRKTGERIKIEYDMHGGSIRIKVSALWDFVTKTGGIR